LNEKTERICSRLPGLRKLSCFTTGGAGWAAIGPQQRIWPHIDCGGLSVSQHAACRPRKSLENPWIPHGITPIATTERYVDNPLKKVPARPRAGRGHQKFMSFL
jgi:hypothetical protein